MVQVHLVQVRHCRLAVFMLLSVHPESPRGSRGSEDLNTEFTENHEGARRLAHAARVTMFSFSVRLRGSP